MKTQLERDYDALKLRYEALSRDWHRQRDIEDDWRYFARLTRLAFFAIVGGWMLLNLMGWS